MCIGFTIRLAGVQYGTCHPALIKGDHICCTIFCLFHSPIYRQHKELIVCFRVDKYFRQTYSNTAIKSLLRLFLWHQHKVTTGFDCDFV